MPGSGTSRDGTRDDQSTLAGAGVVNLRRAQTIFANCGCKVWLVEVVSIILFALPCESFRTESHPIAWQTTALGSR